ncbi:hypothetical protein B9Z31_15180 [Limnohabitans sp. G3-2]|nr:hypothetical protein B9Z31_15180 [Limnohabitans sp. G3-2]
MAIAKLQHMNFPEGLLGMTLTIGVGSMVGSKHLSNTHVALRKKFLTTQARTRQPKLKSVRFAIMKTHLVPPIAVPVNMNSSVGITAMNMLGKRFRSQTSPLPSKRFTPPGMVSTG